ncbi:hypothetical protein IGI39_004248 [Enterococcus sp. AZ135]|uniref:SDR family NAD(P)-dependent oxidoreductase n=1 Tax=unclassified Enterococcus TaxID=2608891 RepID=UPI003F1F4B7D
MKTIVIIGAGPNLGLSLAKKFGENDFQVALIARNMEKLQAVHEELNALGIKNKYYQTDISALEELKAKLGQVEEDFGQIDVVEFSPYAGPQEFRNAETMELGDVEQQLKTILYPAIEVVQALLPGMKKRQEGAFLFNSGISALYPIPQLGNTGIAASGLRNYVYNLHNILKDQGIYVGFLAVSAQIEKGTAGDPDLIANQWYDLYSKQEQFETVYPNL